MALNDSSKFALIVLVSIGRFSKDVGHLCVSLTQACPSVNQLKLNLHHRRHLQNYRHQGRSDHIRRYARIYLFTYLNRQRFFML